MHVWKSELDNREHLFQVRFSGKLVGGYEKKRAVLSLQFQNCNLQMMLLLWQSRESKQRKHSTRLSKSSQHMV